MWKLKAKNALDIFLCSITLKTYKFQTLFVHIYRSTSSISMATSTIRNYVFNHFQTTRTT